MDIWTEHHEEILRHSDDVSPAGGRDSESNGVSWLRVYSIYHSALLSRISEEDPPRHERSKETSLRVGRVPATGRAMAAPWLHSLKACKLQTRLKIHVFEWKQVLD